MDTVGWGSWAGSETGAANAVNKVIVIMHVNALNFIVPPLRGDCVPRAGSVVPSKRGITGGYDREGESMLKKVCVKANRRGAQPQVDD
jgi:hypothetical protein